jgi:fluoride exporter
MAGGRGVVMSRTLSTRRRLLAVFCGGFLGAVARYLLSGWLQAGLGKGWPSDVLLINVTGAFTLAFVTTLADATFLIGPTRRLFINVGFLGAYTTFSSFSLGADLLVRDGHWLPALLYLLLSMLGAVLAVALGEALGHWILATRRRSAPPSRKTRTLTETLAMPARDAAGVSDHLDVQDDLLLPHKTKEGRRGRGGS